MFITLQQIFPIVLSLVMVWGSRCQASRLGAPDNAARRKRSKQPVTVVLTMPKLSSVGAFVTPDDVFDTPTTTPNVFRNAPFTIHGMLSNIASLAPSSDSAVDYAIPSLAPSSFPSDRVYSANPSLEPSSFPSNRLPGLGASSAQPSFGPTKSISESNQSDGEAFVSVSNTPSSSMGSDAGSIAPSALPSGGEPTLFPTEGLSSTPSLAPSQTPHTSSPPPSFEPTLSLQSESPVPSFAPTAASTSPSNDSPPTEPSLFHLLRNMGNGSGMQSTTPPSTDAPRPALARMFNNIAQLLSPPAWYSFLVGSSTTNGLNAGSSGPSILDILTNSNHRKQQHSAGIAGEAASSCGSHKNDADCTYLFYFSGKWVHSNTPGDDPSSCTERCTLLKLVDWSTSINGWQCGTCGGGPEDLEQLTG